MVSGNIKYYAKIGNLEEELARQYGEIEDYVRRMDETMQELEYKYVTGNPGIRFRSHPEQAFG